MISISKNIIPFFSVVITCYNREAIIRQSIDSLLNQTESDWECIIVDDGSTDDTYLVAKKYCDSDSRFRYIYQSNRKQAVAKNVGILAASGVYVTFLDSDDEYEPTHLESRKRILFQNPDVELLHGGVKIIGNEYVPDMYDTNELVHLSECVIGGTFFMRKETAIDLGGFPHVPYGDDTALFDKALESGLVVAKIDFPTYIYHRNSPDSLCNNMDLSNE
jgi:glycosyltransferase involved in cell wall biosynthesis